MGLQGMINEVVQSATTMRRGRAAPSRARRPQVRRPRLLARIITGLKTARRRR
jgi:hypothetical protein